MRATLTVLLLLALAGSAAACDDEGDGQGAPSPTTALEPAGPSTTWSGMARLSIAGGPDVDLTTVVDPVTLEPASDLLATWISAAGDYALVLAWTEATEPEVGVAADPFSVTIWTPDTTRAVGPYRDDAGGCSATLETLRADSMSGSFDCPSGLKTPDGQLPEISASGTFEVYRIP